MVSDTIYLLELPPKGKFLYLKNREKLIDIMRLFTQSINYVLG